MKALYFFAGHPAPLPFYVEKDGPQAIAAQLGLSRDAICRETPDLGDDARFSIYSILDAGGRHATAEAEANRLTGQASKFHGSVLITYKESGLYPLAPEKPLFEITTEAGRSCFAKWAALVAGALAFDSPYRDARQYWDFLCDEEVSDITDSEVPQGFEDYSTVMLLGIREDFSQPFIEAAQPAIDRIFNRGLRSAFAVQAYDSVAAND